MQICQLVLLQGYNDNLVFTEARFLASAAGDLKAQLAAWL